MSYDLSYLEDDAPVEDIDLGCGGEILPPANNLIALIDADTLAYTSCLLVEQREDLLPRDFYGEEEYKELISLPEYDGDTNAVYTVDIDEAYDKAMEKLERIYQKTGCRTAEMHFSHGRENFRYDVLPSYKANRKGKKTPAGLYELKKRLNSEFDGGIHTKVEADDVVVYLRKTYPEKYLMVAVDKDLLNSIEGKHFNYYESSKYDIDMRWHEVDADVAMKWPFLQALMGDPVDGIKGVAGVGKVKAAKMLAECTTSEECWEVVKKAYGSVENALITMRLVDMHQYNGKEVVLWPPKQ